MLSMEPQQDIIKELNTGQCWLIFAVVKILAWSETKAFLI